MDPTSEPTARRAGDFAALGWLRALYRYGHLWATYLRPHWPLMLLLSATLGGTIAAQVTAPLVIATFIDAATSGGTISSLIELALLAIGIALAGQVLAVAETYAAERVSWAATNALRLDLVAHVLRLDAAFHAAHTPGELIERVDGDVATLARFFSRFVVYVFGNGLLLLAVVGLLYAVDWRIGLGLSAFVAAAVAGILRIRSAATPASAAERQASADFYGLIGEHLAGLEDVRSSGAGAFVLRRCAESMRTWLAITRKARMWAYAMAATSQTALALSLVFAFAVSAMLYKDGVLRIGAVYLTFQYALMLGQPTEQIRRELEDLQQADASMGRVEALMATTPHLIDGTRDRLPHGPLQVEFDAVSFTYVVGTPVLHDVTVRLDPGRVLGIVGATGSGKTTLTRLLMRFYDPSAGAVRLGGADLRSMRTVALRERIGLVTQDVQLFNASARDNVTLFDDTVPDDRILEALEAVGLGSWLRELPDGLNTPVGPGGSRLSAGQAQLLACARVFLRDPGLVILDEASSRLDPATEQLVHAAFGRLLAGRTGIIVAHRLATIDYADEVLVLEDGYVREYGTRQALAANPASRFAGLLAVAREEVSR